MTPPVPSGPHWGPPPDPVPAGPGWGSSPDAGVAASAGSIYDLGYRRYEGPRLGRRQAVTALLLHSLRSSFGIGRGGRSKLAPFGLAALALIPAVVAVGLLALARQAGAPESVLEEISPIRYATYFGIVGQLVVLFCAAQAPELLGRDQRHRVLALYFSRALQRTDYALARYGGFTLALLLLVLAPQAVLLFGRALSDEDAVAALAADLPVVGPILVQGILTATLAGGVALAIAAFTPRRAYATVAIIAAFTVPPVVAEIIREMGLGGVPDAIVLLSPPSVLEGTNAHLFDATPEPGAVRDARLSGELWLGMAAAWIGTTLAILVRRYRTIAA